MLFTDDRCAQVMDLKASLMHVLLHILFLSLNNCLAHILSWIFNILLGILVNIFASMSAIRILFLCSNGKKIVQLLFASIAFDLEFKNRQHIFIT